MSKRSKVIVIANSKGGPGKSTIACNLAVEAAREKKKVLLIDADEQQSSLNFRSARAENETLTQFQAVSIAKNTIHKDIGSFTDFDYIFIDAGGRDSATLRSAILSARPLLLIPVLPSQYDIWATAKTIEILEEARSLMDIKAVLLLNQVNRNTTIAKDALEALQEFKLPILDTEICQRIAFKRAITEGKGVSEYEPAGKAAAEIKNLWKEVKEIWKMK